MGNVKYAAKYQKSVNAIANHIQKEYKGGPEIAKAVKKLKLPTILIPGYPAAKAGWGPLLSIQETYSCGNKMSNQPRRESPCSSKTRRTHMPLFLDSAHWSSTAKSRDWMQMSKLMPTRMWSSY